MLSKELEVCLNQAFHQARSAGHESLTVEQLLLAILDAPKVHEVLEGCGADFERLGTDLRHHVETNTPRLSPSEKREVQPTLGFQRVLQRAVFHVQSGGKKEVGVLNVLVAIFSEKGSHAVQALKDENVTRLDVVNYIGHGLTRGEGELKEKEPVSDLRLSARIAALEVLLISLIRRSAELQGIVAEASDGLREQLASLGQPISRPAPSDMMSDELQEAWEELLTRARKGL